MACERMARRERPLNAKDDRMSADEEEEKEEEAEAEAEEEALPSLLLHISRR